MLEVGNLFSKLAEQCESRKEAGFRSGLLNFAASTMVPVVRGQLGSGGGEVDGDGEAFVRALIALGEAHAAYFLALLIQPDANPRTLPLPHSFVPVPLAGGMSLWAAEEAVWVRGVVELLLRTTTLEGSYMVDETVSDLASTFWYSIYEGTLHSDHGSEAEL